MLKTVFFVCAEGAVIDSETSRMSVFNIFDVVVTEGFPTYTGKIYVAAVLARDEDDPPAPKCVIYLSQAGKKLYEEEMTVDFKGGNRMSLVLNFSGLTISGPGAVRFELAYGADTIGSYEIHVRQTGETSMKKVSGG